MRALLQAHCGQQRRTCPSEMDHHAVDDMGLNTLDLQGVLESFNWVMDAAYSTILARGKFTWNQFWNAGKSCCIDCPDPMVTKPKAHSPALSAATRGGKRPNQSEAQNCWSLNQQNPHTPHSIQLVACLIATGGSSLFEIR